MPTEIPTSLYKYESINEYSLRNLKNATLFFNAPSSFNDPYDCSLSEASFVFDDNDRVELFNHMLSIGKVTNIAPITNIKDIPTKYIDQIDSMIFGCIPDIEDKQLHRYGCSCFSENNNHILMWSHYSNSHKGMCLEFDTSYEPFNKVFKVHYSNDFPQINPVKMIMNPGTDIIIEESVKPLLTKFECWQYEAEWRLFHKEPRKAYGYPVEALKAVYFGTSIDEADLEIVCLILQGQCKDIKFFRAQKGTQRYEINFEQFEYTPFIGTAKFGGGIQ